MRTLAIVILLLFVVVSIAHGQENKIDNTHKNKVIKVIKVKYLDARVIALLFGGTYIESPRPQFRGNQSFGTRQQSWR